MADNNNHGVSSKLEMETSGDDDVSNGGSGNNHNNNGNINLVSNNPASSQRASNYGGVSFEDNNNNDNDAKVSDKDQETLRLQSASAVERCNGNYGNYGNYDHYGHYEELNGSDTIDGKRSSKMLSTIGSSGCGHNNSHLDSHSQSLSMFGNYNNNANAGGIGSQLNDISYGGPTRGSDQYDYGCCSFYPISTQMPFMEMQNMMLCQTSNEMKDKQLAEMAPIMFKKVLNGCNDINERIFVIESLRRVDMYNRIPKNDKYNFYKREVPFRNVDLVQLVIIQCIKYFENVLYDMLFNQGNNVNRKETMKIMNNTLQIIEISEEYVRDQSEHTQKSWLHCIINVLNKNVLSGTILADFQRKKSSQLEKPGSKKVLLAGGDNTKNNEQFNTNNDNDDDNNGDTSNNNNNDINENDNELNNNYNYNNDENTNVCNMNPLPTENESLKREKIRKIATTRGCALETAEIIYDQYRNKPCWNFIKTGSCRRNSDCWFGHY